MQHSTIILMLTAASIGFIHTILGPDHYVPFIAIAKARDWNMRKTIILTIACGIGHVLSSIFLGFIGILIGTSLSKLEFIESYRGNLAAWVLIVFGFLYMAWGIKTSFRKKSHTHAHPHESREIHNHGHNHTSTHLHPHLKSNKQSITPWVLFIIFLLGPCEPLIPLLIVPAINDSGFQAAILVSIVFSIVTVTTMVITVMVLFSGLKLVKFNILARYSNALAGFTIFSSGLAIRFLGL
jgi:nickel/cobalt transporter (NicO) family protein